MSLRQIARHTKRIAATLPCSDDGNHLLRVLHGSAGKPWNVVLGLRRPCVRFPCVTRVPPRRLGRLAGQIKGPNLLHSLRRYAAVHLGGSLLPRATH